MRGDIENNSEMIFLISQGKHIDETVLMMDHKYVFYGKILKNIPELSLLPILIWRTAAYSSKEIPFLT